MKTARPQTAKVPKCPVKGWKWAQRLKPRKTDRFWTESEGIKPLNGADLVYDLFPVARVGAFDKWGYIRRRPVPRRKKVK